MTDNVQQVQNPPQTPPQAPQPQLTDEQRIEAIKNFLFSEMLKCYQEFSVKINNLPIDGNLKRIIIEKLDDSWLWVKESFNVLQIQLHTAQPKEEAPAKSQQKRHKAQKSKKR